VLLVLSAHGSAKDRNYALASTMRLTMPNRSQVLRARRSFRVTVTTSPGASLQSIRFSSRRSARAPVTFSADVPAAASGLTKLLKLAVEALPVGRDAGIADEPFFRVSLGHILRKP
jgi:hypothetical protein